MPICGVITASTVDEAKQHMASSSAWVDAFELRLDYLDKPEIRPLLEGRSRPVIATCRPTWEGGRYAGPESGRLALLREADRLGAEYVDIEWRAQAGLTGLSRARRIVSYHDFQGFPKDGVRRVREMRVEANDIPKIAGRAEDGMDVLTLLKMLSESQTPTIGLCMGEAGQATRILGPLFGSVFTYASLPGLVGSAPGQLDVRELRDLYRIHAAGADTRIFGVMGDPVRHSLSPLIHNVAFRAVGLDAVYVAFWVKKDPAQFVREAMQCRVEGLSVTVPHKEEVMKAMDGLDEAARTMGALNTVCRRGDALWGFNTDWTSAARSLEKALPPGANLRGRRVLVFGAGGVARAVVFALMSKGAQVWITNRTSERGARLARETGCEWVPLEEAPACRPEIIAHCTSVGMWPATDACLVPDELLQPGCIVVDTVYNPLETELLRRARIRGCRGVSGLHHFIDQAADQFRMWTGIEPPVDLMEDAARERLALR